jgi:hypothetical protein
MPTVSGNFSSRFIKLDKNIACEYICQQVNSLVKEFMESDINIKECLLTIDIRPISSTTDPSVPKITGV